MRSVSLLTVLGLVFAFGFSSPASAQDIVWTAGGADFFTFFYDSGNDSWDVVFRTKASGTVATGLTNPYGTPPGGVGESPRDYRFDTLTGIIDTPGHRVIHSMDYLVTGPTPLDPGFRTRLREGDPAVDQFAAFRLELDWAASTRPQDAEFVMFNLDPFGAVNQVPYETATNQLSADWSVWDHWHWMFGFSEPGDYELVFDFAGLDGNGTVASSYGTASVNFTVVPEPASLSLLALGGILLFRTRRS